MLAGHNLYLLEDKAIFQFCIVMFSAVKKQFDIDTGVPTTTNLSRNNEKYWDRNEALLISNTEFT